MKPRPFLILAILSICLANHSHAAGLIVVTDPSNPDQLFVPPPGHRIPMPGRVLELVTHQVDVTISDQFAETRIQQAFLNPTSRRLEGTFLFPVPRGAQLKSFTMEINGKPVEAELLAAGKARKIYEDIVRRQRDPALLEFIEQDLYKVRIFPIEPRETKRIEFSYGQLLKSDSGLVSYEYPMSVEKFSSKPIREVSLNIALKTGKPLKTVYSPTHDVEIVRSGKKRATVGYETSGQSAEQDFELFFSREDEGVGMSMLTYRADESEDGYFLLLASPGLVDDPANVLPKDVVFVVDTSGSMAGGKLDQAKKALTFCVDNLNEDDRFEIVRFATDVSPLFRGMESADSYHRRTAIKFIEKLKPKGGTAIDDALKMAMALPRSGERPFIVVFLTDGLPTVGERKIDVIVDNVVGKKKTVKRVFCFGIGHDVNTHLLDRITEKTRAVSEYVFPNEDLEVKVSNFFSKIKDPVLTNPKLRFPEGTDVNKMYPSPLPDIFNGEQLVVAGRFKKEASGAVVLTGMSGDTKHRFAEDVALSGHKKKHEFIVRLWATRRIGWLINEIRLRGESEELKQEITMLAREHGIVTPYTAWLIVEDEERRGVRPELRTLRQTPRNQAALDYSQQNFRGLSTQQSGPDATLSARYGARAVRQKTAAPTQDSSQYDESFLRRYSLQSPPQTAATAPRASAGDHSRVPISASATLPGKRQVLPSDLAKQSRVVGGKTFFQNGDEWIDAEIQKHAQAKRVTVAFNSAEYFELMRKNARFARWATMGTKLQFYFDGTIYEIE